MDMTGKDAIKAMIELSNTWEEADKIIQEFAPCKKTNERLAYLYGMFDVSIIASYNGSEDDVSEERAIENDYKSVLSAIVNQKWR
jgi:hypothetical protein